jgi:hypothetical protein
MSETKERSLYDALQDLQQDCGVIGFDSKGYNYKYASLGKIMEVLKPLLKKHSLNVFQAIDGDSVRTVITYLPTKEQIMSECPVKAKELNDPQKFGSGVTYAKRYSLSALFCLITDEDDDGASATQESEKESNKLYKQAVNMGIKINVEELKMLDEQERIDSLKEAITSFKNLNKAGIK